VETLGLPSNPAGSPSQAAVTVRTRKGEIYRVIRDFGKGVSQILKWDMGGRAFAPVAADTSASADPWNAEFGGLTLAEVRAASVWSPRSASPAVPAFESLPMGTDGLTLVPTITPSAPLTPAEREAKVSQLADLHGRLARAEQLAESADDRANAVARESEARRRLGALDALKARRDETAGRKDEMTPFLQGPDNIDALLDAYVKAVPAVETERTALAEEAESLSTRIADAGSRPFLKAPMFWAGAGVTGVSFLVALILPMEGWYRSIYLVGLVAGLGLLVAALIVDFQRLAAKRAAEEKLAEVQKKTARLDDRLKKTFAGPVALIAQTNSGDVETFKARRRAAKEWAAELQALDEQEGALLRGKTRADLEADWQAAKARADALVRQGGEEVDVESLRDAIRRLTQELESAPGPAAATQSAASTGAGFSPLRDHGTDIGRCLARLSGGRLESVVESGGAVCVTRRGAPDAVPIDALSSGEAQLARVALTLGPWIARSAGLGMPLILDDPLSGLDQEARTALIETLAASAGDRQILLFTNAPVSAAAGLTQIALPAA
jgi:hypothetical protein